jgi:hypothetical protein
MNYFASYSFTVSLPIRLAYTSFGRYYLFHSIVVKCLIGTVRDFAVQFAAKSMKYTAATAVPTLVRGCPFLSTAFVRQ